MVILVLVGCSDILREMSWIAIDVFQGVGLQAIESDFS